MSTIEEKKEKQFYEILKQQKISSVFQPIVSLVDGEVYGFEALSRIEMEDCLFQTEELFQIAEKLDAVWEIEAVCRKKSLQNARSKPEHSKLFINVDPNIIHDDKFKSGMTCAFLKEFGSTASVTTCNTATRYCDLSSSTPFGSQISFNSSSNPI